VLGRPESLLDAPQLVIGVDHEVRIVAEQVGGVTLPPCQRAGFGF